MISYEIYMYLHVAESPDSSVNIEIRLRAARPGFNSDKGNDSISFFATASRPALGPI
jgi:hypothetical protein